LRLLLDLGRGLLHQRQDILGIHCSSCHAVQSSVDVPGAWRTPVVAVGTDPKMILNSARMSDAGLLTGALMPPPAIGARVGNPAKAGDILANTVVGTLLAEAVLSSPGQMAQSGVFRALRKDFAENLPREKSRRVARSETLRQGQGRCDDQDQGLHHCAAEQPV
jgi:hypothetical protein